VRFFTDKFILDHQLNEPTTYRLFKRVSEVSTVECVLIGDEKVPFNRQNGFVVFENHANHPGTTSVRVVVAPVKPSKAYPTGIKYQASVAIRRALSELRDNILARNRFALKASRLLMKSLKQTVR
jgi:hypothetical protein